MANKMLIDAAHPEETRVTVVRGNRVEEFDFESASRKQLRGNIYLAKVTRVEPSLQAAFVEYGGNRHGFLAFSEIHPDYYQIPMADRQALLAEEELHARDDDAEEEESSGNGRGRRQRRRGRSKAKSADSDQTITEDAPQAEDGESAAEQASDGELVAEEAATDQPVAEHGEAGSNSDDASGGNGEIAEVPHQQDAEDAVESVGAGDALEELRERRDPPRRGRQYKIQEVIKRRQVLLVQAVKEERGSKGAALTTYLSLAGRYSVLMPNTARGGGISRKITNATDRKKMKEIASDLDVPEGMGVILRTAGANRTKAEIKRDFEYLLRLWETVRETTLSSSAPALVYEEGSLVKRAIRDLYNRDIDEIQVAGDAAHREAKDFMRMLMPSHSKNVKPYREQLPIFTKFGVEPQLDALFSNVVTLKSGGYIVINQTEALVAIDVNSGRATREHNIEDTALKTNLEAADEVARQLRLRDLAGLIVVDFIDMEESRNNRAVEKRMKDCLKEDRARIQVGRISHFGLLEMSRQRIRTGVLESSSEPCRCCAGSGMVRSVPSVALHVLRTIEDYLMRNQGYDLVVRTRSEVALYILNQKRSHLRDIETRFGIEVMFSTDDALSVSEHCVIQKGEPSTGTPSVARSAPAPVEAILDVIEDEAEEEAAEAVETGSGEQRSRARDDEQGEGGRRRRRRRRRGGRGNGENGNGDRHHEDGGEEREPESAGEAEAAASEATDAASETPDIPAEDAEAAPARRRGRRGSRRGRGSREAAGDVASEDVVSEQAQSEPEVGVEIETVDASKATTAPEEPADEVASPPAESEAAEAAPAAAPEPQPEPEPAPEPVREEVEDPNRPRRSGWWNRLRG